MKPPSLPHLFYKKILKYFDMIYKLEPFEFLEASDHTVRVTDIGPTSRPNISN